MSIQATMYQYIKENQSIKKAIPKRRDILISSFIGVAIGILLIPILASTKSIPIVQSLLAEGVWFFPILYLFLVLCSPIVLYMFSFLSTYYQKEIFYTIGKYGFVGLLNTVLVSSIVNSLVILTDIEKGVTVTLFFIVAVYLTIINSFFWNKYWVFQKYSRDKQHIEFTKFSVVFITTELFAAFSMHILVSVINTPFGLAQRVWINVVLLLLIPLSFLGNFFGNKLFVFKMEK